MVNADKKAGGFVPKTIEMTASGTFTDPGGDRVAYNKQVNWRMENHIGDSYVLNLDIHILKAFKVQTGMGHVTIVTKIISDNETSGIKVSKPGETPQYSTFLGITGIHITNSWVTAKIERENTNTKPFGIASEMEVMQTYEFNIGKGASWQLAQTFNVNMLPGGQTYWRLAVFITAYFTKPIKTTIDLADMQLARLFDEDDWVLVKESD